MEVGAIALQLPNTAGTVQIVLLHAALVALFAGAAMLLQYSARTEVGQRSGVAG